MQLPPLPDDVLAVADGLQAGLERILDDAFASFFLYGAVAFPRPEGWHIDFDFHVLLPRTLTDAEQRDVRALYRALAGTSELGGDLDGYFVLLADAARPEPPPHQLDRRISDEAWALHRAHIHAGRYFLISGLDPIEIVPAPTWPELEAALHAEMKFVNEHPEAQAFGILNGCRVLCSFERHDVVMSKYQATEWALASLPPEWHGTVDAASRRYARTATATDLRTIETNVGKFIAYVNRSLPPR